MRHPARLSNHNKLHLPILLLLLATQTAAAKGVAFVRENYTSFDCRIPMRDGIKLFTSRTPALTHHDHPQAVNGAASRRRPYLDSLGPSELFAREKFIFAYQDVRGRYMSQGDFVNIPRTNPSKSPSEVRALSVFDDRLLPAGTRKGIYTWKIRETSANQRR